jgi:hypothetical protein
MIKPADKKIEVNFANIRQCLARVVTEANLKHLRNKKLRK